MKTGLPAKYARMGFARGWAAFRKIKKGGKTGRAKKTSVKVKGRAPTKTRIVTVHVPKKGASMGRNLISKSKLEALQARAKNAVKRATAAHKTDLMEAGSAVGVGLVAAVASSYGIGFIPLPAAIPKPALVKSGLQFGAGMTAAIMSKNKWIKYGGYGMAIIGGMGMLREVAPIPTFAGEVDQAMFGYADEYMGDEFMGDPLNGDPLNGDPLAGYADEFMGEGASRAFSPYK